MKRLRKSSPNTPFASQGNKSCQSSRLRSSPISLTQIANYAQKHPSKRISLYSLPAQRDSSVTSHPDDCVASSKPNFNVPSTIPDIAPAESDADVEEREQNDSLEDVVMAVDLRHQETVGCSYYVGREEKLYCMEDVKLGGLEILDMCKCFISVYRI